MSLSRICPSMPYIARIRSSNGPCSAQKPIKYKPTTPSPPVGGAGKAYGVDRRVISARFGDESSPAAPPSRKSTCARCECSGSGLILIEPSGATPLVLPNTPSCSATGWAWNAFRSWIQRCAMMCDPPAPGCPSGTAPTSASRAGSGLPAPLQLAPIASYQKPRK